MKLGSEAVTTTLIVLKPTASAIAVEGEPEATVTPSTLTVAAPELVVGVTVTLDTLLVTLAEYAFVPETNAGYPLHRPRTCISAK